MEPSDEAPQENLPDHDFRLLPEDDAPGAGIPLEDPPAETVPAEDVTEAPPPRPRGRMGAGPRRSPAGERPVQPPSPPRTASKIKAILVFGIPILFVGFLAAGFVIKNKSGERLWIGALRMIGLLSKVEKQPKVLLPHPRIEAFHAAQEALTQQELLLKGIEQTITEHDAAAPWEKEPALAVHDRLDAVASQLSATMKELDGLTIWVREYNQLRGEAADVFERIPKDDATKDFLVEISAGRLTKDSPELAKEQDVRKYAELIERLELRQYAPAQAEPAEYDAQLRQATKLQGNIRGQRARIPSRQSLTGEAAAPPPEGENPPAAPVAARPRETVALPLEPAPEPETAPPPPPPPAPASEPEVAAPMPAPEPEAATPVEPPSAAPEIEPVPPPQAPVEPPKAEPPQLQPWSRFKPGAWVRFRITSRNDAETSEWISDTVLLDVDNAQVVLQDDIPGGEASERTLQLQKDGFVAGGFTIPWNVLETLPVAFGASEDAGKETIAVGTRQLACMKVTLKGAPNAEFPQAALWLNETIPGLVARRVVRFSANRTESAEAVDFGDDPYARPVSSAQVDQWIVEGSALLREIVDTMRETPEAPPSPEELLQKIARAEELLGNAKSSLAAPDDPRTVKIEKALAFLKNYENRLKSTVE